MIVNNYFSTIIIAITACLFPAFMYTVSVICMCYIYHSKVLLSCIRY